MRPLLGRSSQRDQGAQQGVSVKDRIPVTEVARQYGTRPTNVARLTAEGVIPFHRVENYVRSDGTPAWRYVYLQSVIDADKRRSGELAAERRAS